MIVMACLLLALLVVCMLVTALGCGDNNYPNASQYLKYSIALFVVYAFWIGALQ